MKPGEQGIARLISATRYSWLGFKAAWKYEAAFRQELILTAIGVPLAIFLARDLSEFLFLVASLLLVLIVELANSAIEALVDRVGDEYHELSGRAKDLGSAMVFVALVSAALTWLTVLLSIVIAS
ncbi:diacylglycerol kinase [Parahaliea sp. F7430]|uniref:Diacylglycerol kinase n=1 Tax=Sediminihaliea albiluteola TaxID=2758564 RepID=A0A7W2YK13_9GAMM|nr:diacylglycerol kinase [Sediminihaliea albiluteola]MBA6413677.1 diacylglycerol kinase [Sediminihaliea albiluteola]